LPRFERPPGQGDPAIGPLSAIYRQRRAQERNHFPVLVSCPRGSSHYATDVGDRQATENKGLVSCFREHLHPSACSDTNRICSDLASRLANPVEPPCSVRQRRCPPVEHRLRRAECMADAASARVCRHQALARANRRRAVTPSLSGARGLWSTGFSFPVMATCRSTCVWRSPGRARP
jgi:hypothetical protein